MLGMMILAGCTAKYKTMDVTTNTERLVKNKQVRIVQPANGTYESQVYSNSGLMTAQAVKTAFAHYANDVAVVQACATLDCAREQQPLNDGYYVIPEILHWEDRATQWSGIPDKIEVKITVYNASGNNVLASTILKGSSKWLTFGGDHPQDLLAQPINGYVASLY